MTLAMGRPRLRWDNGVGVRVTVLVVVELQGGMMGRYPLVNDTVPKQMRTTRIRPLFVCNSAQLFLLLAHKGDEWVYQVPKIQNPKSKSKMQVMC